MPGKGAAFCAEPVMTVVCPDGQRCTVLPKMCSHAKLQRQPDAT